MNARQMIAKLDGYGGIIPFNSEELEVTLRALRLLAAADEEGTPETDDEVRSSGSVMSMIGHARRLERERNAALRALAECREDAESWRARSVVGWLRGYEFVPLPEQARDGDNPVFTSGAAMKGSK